MDPERTNVEAQRDDPRSTLSLVRDLLTLRRVLGEGLELLDAAPGVLAYLRGDHAVAINTTAEERPAPLVGRRRSRDRSRARCAGGALAPHSGAITMGLPQSQTG